MADVRGLDRNLALVMRSITGTVRIIDAADRLARKPMIEGGARRPA
jgi:hypothetical protein